MVGWLLVTVGPAEVVASQPGRHGPALARGLGVIHLWLVLPGLTAAGVAQVWLGQPCGAGFLDPIAQACPVNYRPPLGPAKRQPPKALATKAGRGQLSWVD